MQQTVSVAALRCGEVEGVRVWAEEFTDRSLFGDDAMWWIDEHTIDLDLA